LHREVISWRNIVRLGPNFRFPFIASVIYMFRGFEASHVPGGIKTSLFGLALDAVRHDRTRSLLSILAIAIEVAMIFSVVGIKYGIASRRGLFKRKSQFLFWDRSCWLPA
jgi:hypothetical protein